MPFPLKKGKTKPGKTDRKYDEEKILFCNNYQKGTCTQSEASHNSYFSEHLPLSIIYVLSAGKKTKPNKHIQILPLNALVTANDKKSVGQAILACLALQMW